MGQRHENPQPIGLGPGPFAGRGRTSLLDRAPVEGQEPMVRCGGIGDVCRDVGLVSGYRPEDAVAEGPIGASRLDRGIVGVLRGLAAAEADGQAAGREGRLGRLRGRGEPVGMGVEQVLELPDRLGPVGLPVDRQDRGRAVRLRQGLQRRDQRRFEPGVSDPGPGRRVMADDELLRRVVPAEIDLDVVDPQPQRFRQPRVVGPVLCVAIMGGDRQRPGRAVEGRRRRHDEPEQEGQSGESSDHDDILRGSRPTTGRTSTETP